MEEIRSIWRRLDGARNPARYCFQKETEGTVVEGWGMRATCGPIVHKNCSVNDDRPVVEKPNSSSQNCCCPVKQILDLKKGICFVYQNKKY